MLLSTLTEVFNSPCYTLTDMLIWGAMCALLVADLALFHKKEGGGMK